MQGSKQYSEKLFVSFQLSKRVPENNFYRRLKSTIDLDFIKQETNKYYGKEGHQSIDPIVFFKLMLVGYLENICSDRKIIEHASMRLDILFFIGYDIEEELPWHSTLSRTRKLYGDDVFLLLFRKVLSMCISRGMVSGKRQAIDSAFVKANASLDSLVEKEINPETQLYLDQLNENDEERRIVPKKKRIRDGESPINLSNSTHYSPTDPDARISFKPGKPRQLNYYGQISVDTKNHIICGAMADFADKRDCQSLPVILTNTIDNLKPHDISIKEVMADAGYSSGEALSIMEFYNLIGYIPNFGPYKPNREGFTYDSINDQYTCSNGVIIPYRKTSVRTHSIKKEYRSSQKHCKECPIKAACIGKRRQKSIEDTVYKPYYDRMHERMQTNKAKIMMKLRQSTVEPVLGTLINFLNMKRVNTRGIAQANKHVLMATIAYNLKKYMKFSQRKKLSIQLAMKKAFRNQLNFSIYTFLIIWNKHNIPIIAK